MANFSHQKKLFNPKHARRVILFGAGSVGSYVAFSLAKMGVTDIEVWDADVVESHNTPMSLYAPSDVGRPKVDALKERVLALTGVTLSVHRDMYTGQVPCRNSTVVASVDTMEARKAIWKEVKQNPSVDLFCDTRLSRAYVEVLSIDPNLPEDIRRYDALLFDDDTAARQICGTHGIVFSSMVAASAVSATLASFWQEREKKWRYGGRCDTLEQAL